MNLKLQLRCLIETHLLGWEKAEERLVRQGNDKSAEIRTMNRG